MQENIQVSLSPRCINCWNRRFFFTKLVPSSGPVLSPSLLYPHLGQFHHHLVPYPISASPITVSAVPSSWPLPPAPRRASSRPAGCYLFPLHHPTRPSHPVPTQALFPLSRLEKSRGEPKKKEDSHSFGTYPGPAKRFPEYNKVLP